MAIVTPRFRLSFPQLFEPKANDNGDMFYSASLVFEADVVDTPAFKALRDAAIAAGREKFGAAKFDAGVKSGAFKLPFRTDVEEKGYPEGAVFFSAKTKSKPGMVSLAPGPDGKPARLDDPDQFYPGAYCRASIHFYGYEAKGNKGVGVGLHNIQRLVGGDRMDGRMKPEDEFEADAEAGAASLMD